MGRGRAPWSHKSRSLIRSMVVGTLESPRGFLREEISFESLEVASLKERGEGSGASLGKQIMWPHSLGKGMYIRHLDPFSGFKRVNWPLTSDPEKGNGWDCGVMWVAGVCPKCNSWMKCFVMELTFGHPWPSLIQKEWDSNTHTHTTIVGIQEL